MRTALFSIIILVCAGVRTGYADDCAELRSEKKEPLASYVAERYGFSNAIRLSVAETSLQSGCYRQLRFYSTTADHPFEIALYLSPNGDFLLPDVWDVYQPPVTQREAASAALRLRLVQGTPPVRGKQNAAVALVVFSDFQCGFCKMLPP
jgi:hypothetical protein